MTISATESLLHTLGRQSAGGQSAEVESQEKDGSGSHEERDLQMRIAADGTWFYQGTPINRLPLVKLFATVLRREADGRYWLVTPVERGLIQVDDAPFVAVDCWAEGGGKDQVLHFRSNLDHEVAAGPEHPLRIQEDRESGEPRPYVLVRPGLEALINRPVFYRLVEMAVPADEDPERLGLWSGGLFFPLGRTV